MYECDRSGILFDLAIRAIEWLADVTLYWSC